MEIDSYDASSRTPIYSVIVPAYKEEVIIEQSLHAIRDYLRENKMHAVTEVVVVVADSPDSTAQIAKECAHDFSFFQLVEPGQKMGKGRDVREGMLAARGDYLLFTDADLATPAHHIASAFEILEQSDIVIGKRDLGKIHTGYRALLSRCTNIATRLLILPGIHDTQCGFKGFRREVAHDIFSSASINGWSFDIEVLALARKTSIHLWKWK